ncbi:uncharacterized protein LOC124956068 [Vespa velutina]|uniref:uncharacterized protein LOC124956068 n=1 Tax=Vespa velutina TaxID=202808 RepID=UPI001FB2665A|nr:uncharacterized protein LOC124956068 [Vespa velutina]
MSSKVIISDICEYYDLNERLLLQLGLWPYQEKFDKFLRTFIVNVSLLVAFLVEFYRFYISDFDIKSIEEFQIFITLLSGSYCYYNAIFQFELMKKLLDHIIFDYNHISNKQEIIIMRKYAKENKQFVVMILLSFYLYIIILTFPSASHVVLYITGVTNDTQLTLPIAIDTILFDKRFFYLIFFIQLFILWIVTTVAIVNFTTFLLLLSHACALLSIVIFKIDQPLKKNSHELSCKWSSIATCDAYNWIKDIVTHHVNVTEYVP